MDRHVVPADNSCLFTAVGFCVDDRHSMGLSGDLRRRVAEYISSHSSKYDEVTLGRPVSEYQAWITHAEHWGGAIECAVLSDLLGLEVVAVDIRTGTPMRFGEDKGYARRICVIYDGIHYDALCRPPAGASGTVETIFSTDDEAAMREARGVAGRRRASRQFVDTANFTLMCLVCNTGLKGTAEAQAHAKETGHTNFAEYTKK